MNHTGTASSSVSAAGRAPSGNRIIDGLATAGVSFVAAVPDIVTSGGLLWPISSDGRFRLVRVCKEDEGVSICAAMSYNGTRAVLLMQQTGLLDSLNAIRAIGVDYGLPVVMLVGLQGKEPHLAARQSGAYGVRIVPPILDVMGIEHSSIETDVDVGSIVQGIDSAYASSRPRVFLIGREPTAS